MSSWLGSFLNMGGLQASSSSVDDSMNVDTTSLAGSSLAGSSLAGSSLAGSSLADNSNFMGVASSSNSSSNASGGLPNRVVPQQLPEIQEKINQYTREIPILNEEIQSLNFELFIRLDQQKSYSLSIQNLRQKIKKNFDKIKFKKEQGEKRFNEGNELINRKESVSLKFVKALNAELDAEIDSLELQKRLLQSRVDFCAENVKYLVLGGETFRRDILGEGRPDTVVKDLYEERKAITREKERLRNELSNMAYEDDKTHERQRLENIQRQIAQKEREEEEKERRIQEQLQEQLLRRMQEQQRIQEQGRQDQRELLRRAEEYERIWQAAKAAAEAKVAAAKAAKVAAEAKVAEAREVVTKEATEELRAIEFEINISQAQAVASSNVEPQYKEYMIREQKKFELKKNKEKLELEKITELEKIRQEYNRKCSQVKEISKRPDFRGLRVRNMNIDALEMNPRTKQQILEKLNIVDSLETRTPASVCELLQYFCYKMMVTIDETEDTNLTSKFKPDSGEIVGFGNMCNTKCPLCLLRMVPSLFNPDGPEQSVIYCNPLSSEIYVGYHKVCYHDFLSKNQTRGIRDPMTNIPLPQVKTWYELNPPFDDCEEQVFEQRVTYEEPVPRSANNSSQYSDSELLDNQRSFGQRQPPPHPPIVRQSARLGDGTRLEDDRRGGSKRRRTSKLRKRKSKKRKPSNSKKRK
jgi:hypothetical protein